MEHKPDKKICIVQRISDEMNVKKMGVRGKAKLSRRNVELQEVRQRSHKYIVAWWTSGWVADRMEGGKVEKKGEISYFMFNNCFTRSHIRVKHQSSNHMQNYSCFTFSCAKMSTQKMYVLGTRCTQVPSHVKKKK